MAHAWGNPSQGGGTGGAPNPAAQENHHGNREDAAGPRRAWGPDPAMTATDAAGRTTSRKNCPEKVSGQGALEGIHLGYDCPEAAIWVSLKLDNGQDAGLLSHIDPDKVFANAENRRVKAPARTCRYGSPIPKIRRWANAPARR